MLVLREESLERYRFETKFIHFKFVDYWSGDCHAHVAGLLRILTGLKKF